MSEKIVILGASRGLGRALAENLVQKGHNLLLISRNQSKLSEIQSVAKTQVKIETGDFSKDEEAKRLLPILQNFGPEKIFYVAGGGPYGKFHEKEWKDHSWAYRVNFGFPARLLHFLLQNKKDFPELRQMIFVGSSVAESNPDPMASAYSAAKHALLGLIRSVRKESALLDL
ncbi:MAG: SDR family NAD(P)-dependent oxidoreductase, partial [Pseudobdellovibrionaceae bacterium]